MDDATFDVGHARFSPADPSADVTGDAQRGGKGTSFASNIFTAMLFGGFLRIASLNVAMWGSVKCRFSDSMSCQCSMMRTLAGLLISVANTYSMQPGSARL